MKRLFWLGGLLLVLPVWASAAPLVVAHPTPYVFYRPPSVLETGVRLDYPASITTVGEAVMSVLVGTGYRVAVGAPASLSAGAILDRPIPPNAISPETVPAWEALLRLIGPDSRLVVDNRHHLVTFECFK